MPSRNKNTDHTDKLNKHTDDTNNTENLKNDAERRGTMADAKQRHVIFGVFDKYAEVDKSQRFLPHWFQPGVTTFLTFRTADSMPRAVILLWQKQVRDWLRSKDLMILDDEPLPVVTKLPAELRVAYQKNRERLFQWHLDSYHGACVLRNREFAKIVMNSLWHFDGVRYDLDCAIVMPNSALTLISLLRLTISKTTWSV